MFGLTLSPHCGRPRTSKGGALVKVVFSSGQVTFLTEAESEDSSAERKACCRGENNVLYCNVTIPCFLVTASNYSIKAKDISKTKKTARNLWTLGPALYQMLPKK